MREWVGPEVELAFDFHGKMTPALAIEICHELKGMRPMFVEEPVPQENVDALKLVSDHVTFPIATGERLLSRWEFRADLREAGRRLHPARCLARRRHQRAEADRQHGRGLLHAHHAALRDRAGGAGRLHAGRCGRAELPDPGAGRCQPGQWPAHRNTSVVSEAHRAAHAARPGLRDQRSRSAAEHRRTTKSWAASTTIRPTTASSIGRESPP